MSIFDLPEVSPGFILFLAMAPRCSAKSRPKSESAYFSTQVLESRRFYLELTRRARRQITVTSGGWERCRADYKIDRGGFSTPIVEFVVKGSGTLTMGGRDYAISPGSVFVYGPGIPHCIQVHPSPPMEKYFVAFDGGADLMAECHILPGTVLRTMHADQIQFVFDDLIAHGLGDHGNRARMCQIALQYLLMKIAANAIPWDQAGSAPVATYQKCRQFIEEHYLSVRSLAEIAAACHVNSAYLCRLFKRFRRQSPFQYLQNLKMNQAVELLRNDHYSVKRTAQELGFGDPYNFSRAFKRVFGIAPGRMS
jgi:AraC-like DNA-binding protein